MAGRKSGGGAERRCVNVENAVLEKASSAAFLLLSVCHFCPAAASSLTSRTAVAAHRSFWKLLEASGSFFLQAFYFIFQSKVTSSHLHHNLTSLVPPATLQTRLVVNVEGECEEQLETPML